MALVKASGAAGNYGGSSGTTQQATIADCAANDIIVAFGGIDWTHPVVAVPEITGTGITWTPRTTRTPSRKDAGFNCCWTGIVTSAGSRTITFSTGSRDATANLNWLHLDADWTVVGAATTNVQTTTAYTSPSIPDCQTGDLYAAAWQSEYQNANDWGLPSGFVDPRHANGGDGVQTSGRTELSLSGPGPSGTFAATRGGTAVEWCATALALRPALPPPAGTFLPFFGG